MRNVTIITLLTGAALISALNSVVSAAEPTPILDGLQSVFNIVPQPAVDISEALKLAEQLFGGTSLATIDAGVNALVVSLNAGTSRGAIHGASFSAVHIPTYASYAAPDDAAFKQSVTLLSVVNYIYKKGLASKNPSIARDYVRAALLLAAEDDFILSRGFLGSLAKNAQRLEKVADINETRRHDFEDILMDVRKRASDLQDSMSVALFARDRILETPEGQPLDGELLPGAVKYFDSAWKSGNGIPSGQFMVIQEVWTLKNIAISKHNGDVKRAADAVLVGWQTQSGNPEYVQRWLEEALHAEAAAPVKPSVIGFNNKDDPRYKAFTEKLRVAVAN